MHELRWYEYHTNSWEIHEFQIIFGKKFMTIIVGKQLRF
jgi:hypothetical protein